MTLFLFWIALSFVAGAVSREEGSVGDRFLSPRSAPQSTDRHHRGRRCKAESEEHREPAATIRHDEEMSVLRGAREE